MSVRGWLFVWCLQEREVGEHFHPLLSPPKPKFHCTKLHTLIVGWCWQEI